MKPKSIKFVAMTVHAAIIHLKDALQHIYGIDEAMSIAELAIEHVTGFDRMKRIASKEYLLSKSEQDRLHTISAELAKHKPLQYVLGEAWFMGMKFIVNENVLIPRPETEELVDVVIKISKNKTLQILDIGTGSGCISVALKKHLPDSEVHAIDISEGALTVAAKNAAINGVEVAFKKIDILDESQWAQLPSFDIIVSNPPYIPLSEKYSMHENVVNFEPHTALFVPDNDPLIFYKKIAALADQQSVQKVFFEIHQNQGEQLQQYFAAAGLNAILKRDINGHDRFMVLEK